MSLENPTVDDLKTLIQSELACILGEVGTTVGTEIGNLQKQVDLLTGTDTAALLELQTQITNINVRVMETPDGHHLSVADPGQHFVCRMAAEHCPDHAGRRCW
mgnify:CR=1 FL=1